MSSSFDQLVRACTESHRWPLNLLRSQIPKSLLEQHRHRLLLERSALFVHFDDRARIDVLEDSTEESCFRLSKWNRMHDLKEHLDTHLLRRVKDPNMRHVFLSATHSAAPLNCTYDMLLYICTYHQIPFEFVDLLLYSFGPHSCPPRDLHHTSMFQHIDQKDSRGPNIRLLGRSGYETRVGYKLYGMEELSKYDTNEWTLRSTATYHSLDLETGRSFWITAKANDVISKRVIEASSDLSSIPTAPQAALSNAIQTHLIIANWCSENWHFYVSSLGLRVNEMLSKTAMTPIPDEHAMRNPAQEWTNSQSLLGSKGFAKLPSLVELYGPRDSNGKDESGKAPSLLPLQRDQKVSNEQVERIMKRLSALDSFSLGEMRELTSIGLKLKEARMIMSLNVAILKELKEFYSSSSEAPDLPHAIKEGCAVAIHNFKRQMNALERSIESECMRCSTFISQLEDGKIVYGRILDEQSKEMKKLPATSPGKTMKRMHDIVISAKLKTPSRRILTSLILILFSGLCAAVTFFSISSFVTERIDEDSIDEDNIDQDNIDEDKMMLYIEAFWVFLPLCLSIVTMSLFLNVIFYHFQHAREIDLESRRTKHRRSK